MKTSVLSALGGADITHRMPTSGRWRLQSVYVQYEDDVEACIARIEIRTPQKTGYWLANNILLYSDNNNETVQCALEMNPGDEVITRFSSGTAGVRVRSTIHLERLT